MNEDEFRDWYLASRKALLMAIYRCAQNRCGASYEDSEDALQGLFLGMLLHWDEYLGRMDRDLTGRVVLHYHDGSKPPGLLFSFLVACACNKACPRTGMKRNDDDPAGDEEPLETPSEPILPIVQGEFAEYFKRCWAAVSEKSRTEIHRRLCHGARLQGIQWGRYYRGMASLSECLTRCGWPLEDLLEFRVSVSGLICSGELFVDPLPHGLPGPKI